MGVDRTLVARDERRFHAMGTQCHVVVVDGPNDACARAETMVRDLEARWSRFVATSDVARLNAAGGTPVSVAPETLALIRRAEHFRIVTHGWFDPFMARELAALGYDRSIEAVRDAAPPDSTTHPAAAAEAIGEPRARATPFEVDDDGQVSLRNGVMFDPGGIGKGHAADLVASALLEAGARRVLVNLGGDLRAVGSSTDDPWGIAIANPFDDNADPVGQIGLTSGGLATSSPLRRRWRAPDGSPAHHILDPRHGMPVPISLASLTVVSDDASTAEALATAVMLAGPYRGLPMLQRHDAIAYAVDIAGVLTRVG